MLKNLSKKLEFNLENLIAREFSYDNSMLEDCQKFLPPLKIFQIMTSQNFETKIPKLTIT